MITVFVSFRYAEDFSAAKVRQLADNARAKFEGMAGLRSKLFSVFPELREARNVYVWDDAEAAHRFFTPDTRERIATLYGTQPIIEHAEVCALVENARP
jgi:hypothetical protein